MKRLVWKQFFSICGEPMTRAMPDYDMDIRGTDLRPQYLGASNL